MSQADVEDAMERVLAQRTDLDRYGSNKRLMFAADIGLRPQDIHAVAQVSLTDQSGDKGCDFVHVDRAQGLVVVAQAYEATRRTVIAESKAHGLHRAVQQVFDAETKGLPGRLASTIEDVRAAISDGAVRRIEIWFVHNLDDQSNLSEALGVATSITRNAVNTRYSREAAEIDVVPQQISRPRLAEWFRSFQTPILVTDTIRVPVGDCLVERGPEGFGPEWTGYLATVPMEWLKEQFWTYEERLFSGNVRDYLGKISSTFNINNGIRETLRTEPGNFWIYNNGITALVEKAELDGDELVVQGLSIVNGAQTTGALHRSADLGALGQARVVIRFIECADPAVIEKIIKYTNRQNATRPADFRSNDHVQRRLVKEFGDLGVAGYSGGRRGGAVDSIQRATSGTLSATYVAQAVAAFHGDPGIARHDSGEIWADRDTYRRYFNDLTTAAHLLLCAGLAKASDRRKEGLRGSKEKGKAKQWDFFDRPGSTWLLVAALAAALPVILPACPDDRFRVRFSGQGLDQASEIWTPFVEAVGPRLDIYLTPLLKDPRGLRRSDLVREALSEFRTGVKPDLEDRDAAIDAFCSRVEVIK